ncbi:DUF5103 domain-containing protein [Ferruginibacter yonginensis]|uniref:DUF5103 domain-containing protein n=1 Tax=Ferruginibacter yonginensis TaxID=1310416 RepID=A0ABV8QR50_9BACT
MRLNKLYVLLSCSIFIIGLQKSKAQLPDKVYKPYIATAQLFQYGNQSQLPVYTLNSGDKIQLEFDDLEANFKSYYYTYQLCDYNWQPVNLSPFDYMKGFTQNRITTYRYSGIALTRYTHYQAILPEQNMLPNKSGNYLLKVFLDGDTSKLVFTKRLLVVENKATVGAAVVQLLGSQNFTSYQKVRFTVSLSNINAFSAAQQVKVVILQNNRWDNAQKDIAPTFVRGSVLDYTNENIAQFPGGKEFRWLDLRSFRLQSDRIDHADYGKTFTNMYVVKDVDRSNQRYVYYPDYNGTYNIITYESINPFWQGDYATVKFSLVPPEGKPYENKNVYVAGQFTNYELREPYKMRFNETTGLYEASVYMKQGYYSYTYTLTDDNNKPDFTNPLEGNYWETENNYTILVYYKGFTDRTDQLIGVGQINSRNDRPGLRF